MKLICRQTDLNNNLSLVSRAVPSRPSHPVLANVLLVADSEQQKVSLTAFDLSLGIRTSFTAEISEGGKVTLPAKLLNDIISRLPEGDISLVYDDNNEDNLMTITSSSGRFQLRSMSADEFPELPLLEDGQPVMLPVSDLLEGIRGALFAASTDETKQVLTGVHVRAQEENEQGLEFAATDGHRLALVQPTPDEDENGINLEGEEFAVTIPSRALRELEKMLVNRHSDDPVCLKLDEGQIVFELGDQRLTSRKLEGAYPAYQQLIPRQFSRSMTVERKRLINSLELVSVMADQKNNIVRFSLDYDNQQLSLSVETQDVGNARDSMRAEISGESIDIAFNVKYLMDGLKALPSTEVYMQLNQNNQPVIFSPLGGTKMTYLVMPVQIR